MPLSNPGRTPPLNTSVTVGAEVGCGDRLLCQVSTASAQRQAVVEFIQQRFESAYGARPSLRVPQLLALTNASGDLQAAVGVREAGRERLFLEDYLPAPVETLVPNHDAIPRHRIVEVAHLAGVEPGVSRFLFPLLTVWLMARGVQWIAFTGTEQLRNSFERLGIPAHVLLPADPACLPDGGAGWGRYYEHGPKVMVANVPLGFEALRHVGLLRRVRVLSAPEGLYERTA